MRARIIPLTTQTRAVDPQAELFASLDRINTFNPPVHTCSTGWKFSGIYSGPTAIAHLFFVLSILHPDLDFKSQSFTDWSLSYLELGASHLHHPTHPITSSDGGITNEHLSQVLLNALLHHDASLAIKLCSYSAIINNPSTDSTTSNDHLTGRAGYLYLLRTLATHFPPATHPFLHATLRSTADATIARTLADFKHSSSSETPPHPGGLATIDTLTQLLLSSPTPTFHSRTLTPLLRAMLTSQTGSGDFPISTSTSTTKTTSLDDDMDIPTQLLPCSGLGVLISLLSIRRFFPADVKGEIDAAIARRKACILSRPRSQRLGLDRGFGWDVVLALALLNKENDDEQAKVVEALLDEMTTEALERQVEEGRNASGREEEMGLWMGDVARAWVWASLLCASRRERKERDDSMGRMGVLGYNDFRWHERGALSERCCSKEIK